jgi:hypothetical protein
MPTFTQCHRNLVAFSLPDKIAIVMALDGCHAPKFKQNIIQRLRTVMYEDGQILQETPAAENSVMRFIKKKPMVLHLNEMKMIMDYLPTFLECLVWIPSITELFVPCQAPYTIDNEAFQRDAPSQYNTFCSKASRNADQMM